MRNQIVFLFVLGILFFVISSEVRGLTFSDDFEDGIIDGFWSIFDTLPGAEITEADGKLTIYIPQIPAADFSDSGLESVSTFPLQDFECWVDFRVPEGVSMAFLYASAHHCDYWRHRSAYYNPPFEIPDGPIHGGGYYTWYVNDEGYGWDEYRPDFGDETTTWHTLKLVYDAETMICGGYVDGLHIGSIVVELDDFQIGISAKIESRYEGFAPAVVEFDNFNFTYQTTTKLSSEAGSYQCITWPVNTVNLDGTVTFPYGTIETTVWSKVSGQGEVDFGDAGAEDTTATFSEAGEYVLRLTADDGIESVSDDVYIRVREEETIDIDVVNPSFEFYEDGSQILCHMAIGYPETNPTGMDILGWTNIGDWVGVDVYCGAEGVCDDCRDPIMLDGIAYCFMQTNDTQLYQILDEQIVGNSQYTLTFDAISPWEPELTIIPSLFYVDEDDNHVELAIKTMVLNLDHLCGSSVQWERGLALKFSAENSADYIGKPLGIKFICPIPEDENNWKWILIDNVHMDVLSVDPYTCPAKTYTLDTDFDEGVLVGLEHETVSDQLQLSAEPTTLPFMWVPNNDGTVSKVNTETGDELGRYMVAPHSNCSPSRTTVDTDGSCWVGNRQAGTVVKIGLHEAGQWIDRNGDGICQTSRDINGDGIITYGDYSDEDIWSIFDNVRVDCAYDNQIEAIDIENFSFEFDENGNQVSCHTDLSVWKQGGEPGGAGVDVYCGAPDVCEDCRPWPATDGIAYGFIQHTGVEMYQVLTHDITEGRQYTLTVDHLSWGGSFALVFFYPEDSDYPDENHIEICRQIYPTTQGHEWMNDMTVTFTAETGATYIGQPLGVKFAAPGIEPGEPEVLPWGDDECVLYEVVLTADKEGTYTPGTIKESLPEWQPMSGKIKGAIELSGTNYVEIPALNLNSNTVTMSAWIMRDGEQAADATGIVFCRDGNTTAGISFGSTCSIGEPPWSITNELAYNWNDDIETWEFQSGLYIPDGLWVFVAVVVEPTQATLYLFDGYTISSAVNPIAHSLEEFDGVTLIGSDSTWNTRYFKGMIDDVAFFNRALTEVEIDQLYRHGGASFIEDSDLAGLWELDESEGIIASDSSANGNDGILIAGPDYDYNNWGTAPRGLAVDAYNNLWAGTQDSSRYYHIDGSTGTILDMVDVSTWGNRAYGAVIDRNGVLWSSGMVWNHILRLDPSTEPPTISTLGMGHYVYGLGLDYLDHLFIAGWNSSKLSKVDVLTGTIDWTKTGAYESRGIMATSDNNVWTANTAPNTVTRYDNNGNLLATIPVGTSPTGLSVDATGKVWVCDLGDDFIHRIDPSTNTIDLSKSIINSGGHYTYSDMTGIVSRTITTKTGTWIVIHDSGMENSPWGMVSWNGNEPAGTSITVKVSSSDDQINWSPSETAKNGLGLSQTPSGRYLRIEATLKLISGETSPVLHDLTVVLGENLPVADAGGPYIIQAMDWWELIKLDGSGSFDPDWYALTYEWDLDLSFDSDSDGDPANDIDATEAIPEAVFPIGQTDISLTVTDVCGWKSSPDITKVTVCVIKVGIEIKSIDGEDTINAGQDGVVRVTFFTDGEFDATMVDPLTVTLRGEDFNGYVQMRNKDGSEPMMEDRDVDDDGDIDRIIHLDTESLADYELDVICEIGALTYDGYVVLGVDMVHLAPDQTGI